MMNIPLILTKKFPDAFWTLDGETYADLIWQCDIPKPTETELESLWADVQYDVAFQAVESIRQIEYAQRSDPLFFRWQASSGTEQEWINMREQIKTENPYPEKPISNQP
jgi:hypothetical protein